jgi:outer membrane protein insertion porin family
MGSFSFLLLFSLITSPIPPQINIEGNDFFSQNEILHSLNLTEHQPIPQESLAVYGKRILDLYKTEGFLNAEFRIEKRGNIPTLIISEGERYVVGAIDVSGNRFAKDEILIRILDIEREKPFSPPLFERGIEEILLFYGDRGFPFTRVLPSYRIRKNNQITIEIEIEEGPRLQWGKITTRGNTVTRSYVIEKQMKIPTHDYFSESQLRTSTEWLSKLPYLEMDDEIELIKGEESGTVDLLVTIREMTSNRIIGIAGYLPSDETQEGGFVGSIAAEMLNLFGTGRSLHIRWQKYIPPYTKLDVHYREPWILGSRSALKLSLSHLLEDTLYSLSNAQIELETFLSLNLGLSITGGVEIFNPATVEIPKSRKYSLGSGFFYSNLDSEINPRKGIDHRFYTEYGKKSSTNVVKLTLDLLNVIPLFSHNVLTLFLSGKTIRTNTSQLPSHEQFPLGGFNSLRGYRERQFRAVQVLRGSPEFRYLLSRKSRLYLFYDCAYFETCTYPTGESEDLHRDGYGVGAKFDSRLGIVSIEYAIGEEREFMKGKIHIGLDSSF